MGYSAEQWAAMGQPYIVSYSLVIVDPGCTVADNDIFCTATEGFRGWTRKGELAA
jgi:hypothetical protein